MHSIYNKKLNYVKSIHYLGFNPNVYQLFNGKA